MYFCILMKCMSVSEQHALRSRWSNKVLTMLASMICPFPDFVLSSSARTIPRAQVRPPPAKSANRFSGAKGFSPLRPSRERRPVAQNEMTALTVENKTLTLESALKVKVL